MLSLILMVFAFVCLTLAALNVGHPRITLGWLGMAFWALADLLGAAGPMLHR